MIDTLEFKPSESRWGDIFRHLKSKGWDVYPPGVKIGECTEPYVEVKVDGGYKHINFSTNRDMYSITCYVPRGQYSKLEPMFVKIREQMKDLEPMIISYGELLPSYYDEAVKGHYITLVYENHKKM